MGLTPLTTGVARHVRMVQKKETLQELLAQRDSLMESRRRDIEAQIQAQIQEHHLELHAEFYTSVHGASHRNRDRTSRQEIIRDHVYVGMLLDQVFEDDNPASDTAVALVAPGFGQIGYLSDSIADDIRQWAAEGNTTAVVTVSELTGGTDDKPTRGVNLLLRMYQVVESRPAPSGV